MSRRKIDMHAESELGQFLDEYFYSRLVFDGKLTSTQRITNRAIQQQGIDVIATKNNVAINIDEKASLYYINKSIPTFAFELGFISENGKDLLGWFLNDELRTYRYFLLWPNATTSCLRCLKKNDFTDVYGMMIKKEELQDYLTNIGFDRNVLLCKYKELRLCGKIGKHKTKVRGVYFFVSNPSRYSERPINIVISKDRLYACATAVFEIRPDVLKKHK